MPKPLAPLDGSGPWCSICGRMVDDLRPTLDARHPTGVCHYQDAAGILRGHGRVPAVTDHDEARALLVERQRAFHVKRHMSHLAAAPVYRCPVCKAKYPGQYAAMLAEGVRG